MNAKLIQNAPTKTFAVVFAVAISIEAAQPRLDLAVLDPSYRVFFEGHPDPVDLRPDREHNRALFESLVTLSVRVFAQRAEARVAGQVVPAAVWTAGRARLLGRLLRAKDVDLRPVRIAEVVQP